MNPPAWREAIQVAVTARELLIALDFDGTLAPLVPRPEDARMLPQLVALLEQLVQLPATTTVLVSGRAGDSLAACAEVPRSMRAIGSHGAQWGTIEIDSDGNRTFAAKAVALSAEARHLHTRLCAAIDDIVATHPGTSAEYKPAGVVLHVREADRQVGQDALQAARRGPASWDGVTSLAGKAVLELSVVRATKGDALKKLVAETGATCVLYAGDDVTDESAFHMVSHLDVAGVSIKVGEGESCANLRVADGAELGELLAEIARQRHHLAHT
ncbi:MAG: trehalose-phosphatase [Bowdeniella nasicola]|nr:trehalose-phosphatase [Bowdeniella nasicola]